MATISINIPDAIAQRALNGFCYNQGYEDKITVDVNGGPTVVVNPETKVQFLKRKLIEYIQSNVKQYEIKASVSTVTTAIDKDIIMT